MPQPAPTAGIVLIIPSFIPDLSYSGEERRRRGSCQLIIAASAASPVIASDYTPLHSTLYTLGWDNGNVMIAFSVYNLRTRAVQSGVSKQYNVHEKVPHYRFSC